VTVTALLAVEDLVKHFGYGDGSVEALRGVSFAVAQGQFVSIMGPSGSGKSTLLGILAGLEEPTSGRVMFGGQDLAELSGDARSDLRLRKIGFVFQAFNLLPTFTALENVALPLEFLGVRWHDAKRRALRALERVGVSAPAHNRLPSDLAGGEQQRVAIARAIVTEPSMLLADEPTGNLDSTTGRKVLDLLRALNKSAQVTVILVTHSVIAAAYGDRTLELEDGQIVRDVHAPGTRHLQSVRPGQG